MTTLNAELIISESLFSNMVLKLENKLLSKTTLINEIKYHSSELNNSLKKSFDEIVFVLQSVVDSFYLSYYEVEGFILFCESNINEALKHNLSLLNNAKKLIKFIN
jgi:hypothetical protein